MILLPPKAFITLNIIDRHQVIERMIRKPFDSWVKQYVERARCLIVSYAYTMKDTGGTNRSVNYNSWSYSWGTEGDNAGGILVGTGTNAITISDYTLQTKITHGNAAGQLYHYATIYGMPQLVDTSSFFTISRNFKNNSGDTITVNEIGLIFNTATPYYFLMSRDLTGGIDVENTKTLSVEYTFNVTV